MMDTLHARHSATKLEGAGIAGTNAPVIFEVIHQQSKETVSEPNRSGSASIFTKFGKTANTHDVKYQIHTLIQPAFPTVDVCDRRFLCRMAKKLGCQFCVEV